MGIESLKSEELKDHGPVTADGKRDFFLMLNINIYNNNIINNPIALCPCIPTPWNKTTAND